MPHAISSELLGLQAALAGRYSLERELGRGGMGIVFLAHEVALDRPVALKLLPADLAADEEVRARFLQEARTAAKLSHPHIVPIHAVDEIDGYVFFAMAYVQGRTLGDRVRERGPLTDAEAVRLLREVAWALGYAHAQGVVHRDVKPDNILLEEGTGRALVMDFGIAEVGATVSDGAPPDELAERVHGTAEFMSPEQAKGAAVDPRSDLYSLGAVGFFAVSGRAPFEAASPQVVLAKHVTEPAPPVASVAPQVPSNLARTIDRCLRKDPERRFPDGAAVAAALSREAPADRPIPVPLRAFINHLRLSRSSPVVTVLLGLWLVPMMIAMLFGVGGLWGLAVVAAALLLLPFAAFGSLIGRARKVLASGHTLDDLARALEQDVARRNEAFRFDVGERETVVDRVAKGLGWGGVVVGSSALFAAGSLGLLGTALSTFAPPAIVLGIGSLVLASHRARRRYDVVGERWLRILRGALGRGIFKLGGLGLRAPEAIGAGTYRPTEMAISISAARLYEELPRDTKRSLEGLPETVRKLEEDARMLRTHVAELNGVLDEIGDDPAAPESEARAKVRREVTATRDEAEGRLREVFAALETIRLGLLRMHAGERVLHSVTMELDTAMALTGDMSSLLEGHREVERLLAERRATGVFTIVE